MKEPTIQVPVSVFLDLARVYAEEPQELVNKQTYLETTQLEKKAYRKWKEWREFLKKGV